MKERAVYVWTGTAWEERLWQTPFFAPGDIYTVVRTYPKISDMSQVEVTFSMHSYNAERRTDEDIHGDTDRITTSSYGRTPEQHARFIHMCQLAADVSTTLRNQLEEGKEISL
jgi:hypothetical protein